MKSMLGWQMAIVLAATAFALSDRAASAQTLVDPNSAGAADDSGSAAGEDSSRRRSILRRDRRMESAPPSAPTTDAPAFRPSAPSAAAPNTPAAGTAPAIVAPTTAAAGPSGLPPYGEQPAAYAAPLGRPYLGITFDMRYPNAAVVKSVAPGGPAAQSGIRPGDAIHAINRSFIATWQDVVAMVQSLRPGDQLDISYSRRVEERTQVVLTGRDVEGAQTATYGAPAAPGTTAAPLPAASPSPAPVPERAAADAPPAAPAPAASAQPPAAGEDARGGRLGRDRSERPARQRGGLFRRN